jgi:hypothetical protein
MAILGSRGCLQPRIGGTHWDILSHPNPFYLFQMYELLYDRVVLEEGAKVAGPYKVHVSGTISELTGEKFYELFREFLFIVILMYPMPSLTLMLDILGNFLVGVFQFGIRAGRFRSCLGSLEFNKM